MSSPIIETEETLIIETPERVPLAFSLASIGNRFLAVAIDHFIQFTALAGVLIFASMLMAPSGGEGFFEDLAVGLGAWTVAILILVVFAILMGYFIFFEWFWSGQTPGKRLLKLRVIREDGRPITIWEAFARNLLRIFDSIPGIVIPIYSVGLLSVFISRRDQRIGDLVAGTVVIRERLDDAPTFSETFSSPIADAAFRRVHEQVRFDGDISSITESEIEVVENFLRRRWDLSEKQRVWMAWRIALPLMFRIKPGYDAENFSYEGFLEELIHRFHARQRFLN